MGGAPPDGIAAAGSTGKFPARPRRGDVGAPSRPSVGEFGPEFAEGPSSKSLGPLSGPWRSASTMAEAIWAYLPY